MSKKLVSPLGALGAVAVLTLAACSSEDTSADSADAGSPGAAISTPGTDNAEELPDLTYELDFNLMDGTAWPAVVKGHTIRTQEELQEIADSTPEVAAWAMNWDVNSIEGLAAKEVGFDKVEEYGAEVCAEYPKEEIASLVKDPFGQPNYYDTAYNEIRFQDYFEEHYPYPYPIPDEHMAAIWMQIHVAAIYASCDEGLEPLDLELNPNNIEGTLASDA